MLFLEFHGTTAGVAEQSERFGEISADLGGGPFTWTTNTEERTRLWQARHDAYWAVRRHAARREGVRDRRVRAALAARRMRRSRPSRTSRSSKLIAPIVGHVGDGNFHVSPLIDMDDPAEVAAAKAFSERLVERALAMEGTCTGEHGVGQGKMKYLEAEHGEALGVMRAIKHALDPQDLMNPGKIVAF